MQDAEGEAEPGVICPLCQGVRPGWGCQTPAGIALRWQSGVRLVPSGAWIEASRLGATTWVFVYLAGRQKLMTVLCGELDGVPADACAVRAADRAFSNITS